MDKESYFLKSCFDPEDITYCGNKECTNIKCMRHYSKIDWTLPKHSILGASISMFGDVCSEYKHEKPMVCLDENNLYKIL